MGILILIISIAAAVTAIVQSRKGRMVIFRDYTEMVFVLVCLIPVGAILVFGGKQASWLGIFLLALIYGLILINSADLNGGFANRYTYLAFVSKVVFSVFSFVLAALFFAAMGNSSSVRKWDRERGRYESDYERSLRKSKEADSQRALGAGLAGVSVLFVGGLRSLCRENRFGTIWRMLDPVSNLIVRLRNS